MGEQAMKLSESFHMDGRSYSQAELISFCRKALQDQGMPDWKQHVYSFVALFLDPSEGEIFQKTSGTTADPREHQLHRKKMVSSARRTLDYFNLQPGDRALLCLPIRYIAGKMMVVRALVGGLDLVMTEPSGRPLKNLTGPFTFAAMVPLQVHESLSHGDSLSIIRTLVIGGGELHPAVKEKLTHMNSPAIYESFAMTETYTHFALRRINGTLPDIPFRLLDGIRVSQDERGCLEVEVDDITAGKVTTNDLVEIAPSGRDFQWLGRIDHVISSGGIKIIPELLEQQIRQWLGHDCLILPEADEKLGEKLVLVVEYGASEPPVDMWKELLQSKLSGYEVPKRIVTIGEIPRNQSFKPDRKAVQRLL
jgi:O-succinylbenzoic acid--CoA ligase